jgi:hypothetical protein
MMEKGVKHMEADRKNSTWFSKQKLFVKVAIACSGLVILCCLCSIPITIFNPSTSVPEASNTLIVEIEPSPIIVQTEKPTEVPTIAPTNTPKPTSTPSPSTVTPTAIESLLDVFSILGKPVIEVEAVIGSTILITPNDDNDDDNLSGGEYRDYIIGKYSVFVAYDKNGIARVFQVMDGLSDENYSPTQWKLILPQFGVYIDTPPERTAPLAVYWDNYNGYFIAVAGNPVWTVQIAEAEYRP